MRGFVEKTIVMRSFVSDEKFKIVESNPVTCSSHFKTPKIHDQVSIEKRGTKGKTTTFCGKYSGRDLNISNFLD